MKGPIKLLDFYHEEDREYFFGRDAERDELLGLIDSFPIVVLTGESGTGKTSLLLAGILPVLGFETYYHRMNPESRSEILPVFDGPDAGTGRKLIVLDQFEELLLDLDNGGGWFPSSKIVPLFTNTSRTLLLSLRSDYLPLLMTWLKGTRGLFRAEQFLHLSRLNTEKAADIIYRILRYYGINPDAHFAGQLAVRLAELDLEGSVYPPHIQIIASYILRHRESTPESALPEIERILSDFFEREIFTGFSMYDEKLTKDLMDILVGRAGLRRKYTIRDLGRRLNEPEDKIAGICSALIERRVLRRTEEERIELIHDFLSKRFFESLTAVERKKRRYQDMFYSAFMDYREANILLDEKRLRLFLHYRDWLHIDDGERMFLVKSILAQFSFGNNFYLDLSMLDDVFEILSAGEAGDTKFDVLSKSRELIPYDRGNRLKKWFMEEEDVRFRGEVLYNLARLDPEWTRETILAGIRDWESVPETFLEEILRVIPDVHSPVFIDPLTELVRYHPTETIQQFSADALIAVKCDEAQEAVLSLWGEGAIRFIRVIDNFVLQLQKNLAEKYTARFTGLLEKYLQEKDADSYPNIYSAYILHVHPYARELEELLGRIENLNTLEAVIAYLPDAEEPAYAEVLIGLEKTHTDSAVLASIYRALGTMKSEEAAHALYGYYRSQGAPALKYDILNGLIDLRHPEAFALCREIVQKNDLHNQDLLTAGIAGLSRTGDESDLALLEAFFEKTSNTVVRNSILDAADRFPEYLDGNIRAYFAALWKGELENDIRSDLSCKMVRRGMPEPLSFIAERLSKADEEIAKGYENITAFPRPEPIPKYLQALFKAAPGKENLHPVRNELAGLIRHSANRAVAALGIIVYAVLFNSDEETAPWFRNLAETGGSPEIRSFAAAALTRFPSPDSFSIILEMAGRPEWPGQKKLAAYALGIYPCSENEHRLRLEFFMKKLREEMDYNTCYFYLWLTSGCAHKTDAGYLEQGFNGLKSSSEKYGYLSENIRRCMEDIRTKPMEDRLLPDLPVMFNNAFIGWYSSFTMFPY